jgi:uncharacterized membrane protein YhaH (DUF805 family)
MSEGVAAYGGPSSDSFRGRAGRTEWGRSFAWNTVIAILVGQVPGVGPLISLVPTVVILAVTSRRLHDIDRSGWLQVGPMVVWIVSLIAHAALTGPGEGDLITALGFGGPGQIFVTVLFAAAAVVQMAFLGWLAVTPGTQGPNRYGEVG